MDAEKAEDLPIREGLVLRPGDHVLVAIGRMFEPEQGQFIKMALSERFPDVEFTIVEAVALAKVD